MLNGKYTPIKGRPGWWYFTAYLGKGPDGKYRRATHEWQQTKNGKAGEDEAGLAWREWIDQIEADLEVEREAKDNITLGDYLEYWLAAYVKITLEPRTYESYRDECRRHIIPEMGHIPLQSLTPKNIQGYFGLMLESGRKDQKGGLSLRTVKYHRSILSKALNQAVDLEQINANPVKRTKLAQKKRLATDKMYHVLEAEQLAAFLDACREEYFYSLIYTAAFSGMRLSELVGLTWDCIDWDKYTIEVNKSAHISEKYGNAVRPGVKTESSRRVIDVDPSVMEVLRDHKVKQMTPSKKRKRMLPESTLPLVFKNRYGKPYRDDNVQRRFSTIAERCGLPPEFTFHNLRHSHASILIAAGRSPKEVSERLGHADITITLRYYVHVMPKEKRETGTFFGNLLRQSSQDKNESEKTPLQFFCSQGSGELSDNSPYPSDNGKDK